MASWKSLVATKYAHRVARRLRRHDAQRAVSDQNRILKNLVAAAAHTAFGKHHDFGAIRSYADFRDRVPVRGYEGLKPWMDQVIDGKRDVLWKGRPLYLLKSSGTTSGTKYIPATRASIRCQSDSATHAVLNHIAETGQADLLDGRWMFLQASPILDRVGNIDSGFLSGAMARHVPWWLRRNNLPSWETNCIADGRAKMDAIVEETRATDIRIIGGSPPWVQMYFERLLERTGAESVADIFPNLSLFVHGGVSFGPYRTGFGQLMGRQVPRIETYPASEGFIAWQDSQRCEGLRLVSNHGMFFEFIPADSVFDENPKRISLNDAELGVNYALILSTNAGLWGYRIGDTVKFVSKSPWRLVVTGRIEHFVSVCFEKVIAKEVETAMEGASTACGAEIAEFHVASRISLGGDVGKRPCHEWLIEFARAPADMDRFRSRLEESMQAANALYRFAVEQGLLRPLLITRIANGGFAEWMKSRGKLDAQHKVPRLSNDRSVASGLRRFVEGDRR